MKEKDKENVKLNKENEEEIGNETPIDELNKNKKNLHWEYGGLTMTALGREINKRESNT